MLCYCVFGPNQWYSLKCNFSKESLHLNKGVKITYMPTLHFWGVLLLIIKLSALIWCIFLYGVFWWVFVVIVLSPLTCKLIIIIEHARYVERESVWSFKINRWILLCYKSAHLGLRKNNGALREENLIKCWRPRVLYRTLSVMWRARMEERKELILCNLKIPFYNKKWAKRKTKNKSYIHE